MRTVTATFEDVIPAKSQIDSPMLDVPEPFFPRFVRWKGNGRAPVDVAFLDISIDGYSMFAQVRGIDRPKGLSLATFDQVEPGQSGLSIEWAKMQPDSEVMLRFVNHSDQDVRVVLEIEGWPMAMKPSSVESGGLRPYQVDALNNAFQADAVSPSEIDAKLKTFKACPRKFELMTKPKSTESDAVKRGREIHEELERHLKDGEPLSNATATIIYDEAHRIPVKNVRLRVVPDPSMTEAERHAEAVAQAVRKAEDEREPPLRLVDHVHDEIAIDTDGDEYD